MSWILAAFGAALFAGLVAILAKLGVATTDSDVATAIRTGVVLVMAWAIAAGLGTLPQLATISPRTWVFLVLSGLATGGSWLCYFRALSLGDVNKVTPIDKSSAVLATLLAIVLFAETAHLASKLLCTAVILVGTLMMIERKDVAGAAGSAAAGASNAPGTAASAASATAPAASPAHRGWLAYAVAAAAFAALTAILGKVGIDGVDSTLGTAIRTVVVFLMAWAIVLGRGKTRLVPAIPRRELTFLILSGLATGASWLCYYHALQTGVVSVVVQIDKLSVLLSVAFAALILHERLSRRAALGLTLLTLGTLALTFFA